MSKIFNNAINSYNHIERIRAKSIQNMRDDFVKSPNAPCDNKWDLRTYTDEDGKIYYPYVFAKTLAVSEIHGMPLKEDVDLLLKAIESGSLEDINDIKQSDSSMRKLENITAGLNYNLSGADSFSVRSLKSKLIPDSERMLFEMFEVYYQQQMLDISFYDIEIGNPDVQTILGKLNSLPNKSTAPTTESDGMISNKTLLRGDEVGCTVGPYISQYLYSDFKYGSINISQKYNSEFVSRETTTDITPSYWVTVQEGGLDGTTVFTPNRYVNSGRVLGSIVHSDPLFYFYYNAALISFQLGIGSEYKGSNTNSAWISGGNPSILESVASVSVEGLQTAWYNKYNNLTIRPEVFSQRIWSAVNSTVDSHLVQNTPGYAFIRSFVENYNLSGSINSDNKIITTLYPEGSPTHPSQPAGHSLVAGSCVTILKAMLDTVDTSNAVPESKPWPSMVLKHSIDGTSLVDYNEPLSGTVTINGELNKLASNISIGRNWAGVHYRSDADLELGEKVAIAHLINKCLTFHESNTDSNFNGFSLQKFDGSYIRITKDGVSPL